MMADVAAVSPFRQSPPVAFIRPDFSSSDDARLGGFVTFCEVKCLQYMYIK